MSGSKRGHRPKRTDAEVTLMVGGGELLLSIIVRLIAAVRKLLSPEQVGPAIRRLASPAGESIIGQMAALVAGQPVATALITADFWSKFLELLIRAGNFVSYANPDINGKNFPYQPGDLDFKKVEVVSIKERLKTLDRDRLSTQEVMDFLAVAGYRPATLFELLWWWIQNLQLQNDCLVVALGSVWDGDVPFVDGHGADRELYLNTVEGDWDGCYGFAAVRK